MTTILFDQWGREVELVEDERGFVYRRPGMEVIRPQRQDEEALDLIGMHDAPPPEPTATEE